MPHKHTRPPSSLSTSQTHDLPPSTLARPLPVSKSKASTTNPSSTKSHPPKPPQRAHNPSSNDDTPRAFTRLMTYASTGIKTPHGLDDGLSHPSHPTNNNPNSKKRKRGQDSAAPKEKEDGNAPVPKILPSERIADYNARVDAALPVAGLVNKSKKVAGIGGVERQSRMEKRMQRMRKEWREAEERRKAKIEELEEEEDGGAGGVFWEKGKKTKKGKGDNDEDDDPWAIVAANRKRELAEREKGLNGKGGGG
ncbi:MAG: hypothetical protein Q9184_005942, partial [Pyrenodesmia sp. 2 TL-2023]